MLSKYLDGYTNKALERWEGDLGSLSGDQWNGVAGCGIQLFNFLTKTQLYIVLRSHYTPGKLHNTLIFEKYVYQHSGCLRKFDRMWALWLQGCL